MGKKSLSLVLSVLMTFCLLCVSVFAVTKDVNAYMRVHPTWNENNPQIKEHYNGTQGTSELTLESKGNSGASTFYFYSDEAKKYSSTTVIHDSLRDFSYNMGLSDRAIYDVSAPLFDTRNFVDATNKFSKDIGLETLSDKFICHDNNGVYYVVSCVQEIQQSGFVIDGTPAGDYVVDFYYELIPIAENVKEVINPVEFNQESLNKFSNTSGDLYLESNNDYSVLLSKAKNSIHPNIRIIGSDSSYYDVDGVVPYTDMKNGGFMFFEPKMSVGTFEFGYDATSNVNRVVGNGVVTYAFTPVINMATDIYSVYQDGDVSSKSYTYKVSCVSPYNGKVKIKYTKPGSDTVVSTKTENISNGEFSLTIPSGQFASFTLPSYETFLGGYKLNQTNSSGMSYYFAFNGALRGMDSTGAIVASVENTFREYIKDKNDYHGLLQHYIKEDGSLVNMKKDQTISSLISSEWGERKGVYVYNTERDGILKIDSINNIGKTVSVTGDIELSDKSINLHSSNFDITNGKGTFTSANNKAISLTSLPRVLGYTISNVKTSDGTEVTSVSPKSGDVGQSSVVKITLKTGTSSGENPGDTPGDNPGDNPGTTEDPKYYDSNLKIDGINTGLASKVDITGNIELSDSKLNLTSSNFNIVNGKGTFKITSLSSASMFNLLRGQTYKLSNVKVSGSGVRVSSVSPQSGTLKQGDNVIKITLKSDSVVAYDSSFKVDGVNNLTNPVEITGNVEFSDKSFSYSSSNFKISNGKGTFTLKSNSSILLMKLLRGQTYKVSNVTCSSGAKVVSVTPTTGTLNQGVNVIKVNLSADSSVNPPVENPKYTGSIKLDAQNDLSKVVNITGNIEFSDNKLTYSSTYFNIKDGKGTFKLTSNKTITLNSLLAGQTYKVSNVKTDNSKVTVSSISSSSGVLKDGVTSTVKIKLKESSSVTPTPTPTPTITTGQTVWAKVLPTSKAGQLKVSWSGVKSANYYLVYGSKTGKSMKKLAKVTGTSYTHKKLKKTAGYQYKVIAYHSSGKQVGKSRVIKAIANKSNKKYSNVKRMTVTPSGTIYMNKGQSKTLKVVQTRYNKKKAYYMKGRVNYIANNSNVVSLSGSTIKAVGKGKTTVDVVNVNGLHSRIAVVVN